MAGRHRWLISGTLLMLAGALTGFSAWRHWSPCRPDLSTPACELRQEETVGLPLWAEVAHRDVVGTALVGAAAALLVLAWWASSGLGNGSTYRTGVMAFVGLQPLLVAVLVEAEVVAPGYLYAVVSSGWLLWPAELLVFPVFLGQGWLIEETPVHLLRLLALAWGVTSFGPLHHFADHVGSMLRFPVTTTSAPGLGYVTAATQVSLGLVVVVITLLLPRPEPTDGDELTGRDGFTLAA